MNETLTPEQAAKAIWVLHIKPLYNVAEISRRLGLAKATVHAWVKIPEDHVSKMSEMTGKPKHELRPDLFIDPSLNNPWDN